MTQQLASPLPVQPRALTHQEPLPRPAEGRAEACSVQGKHLAGRAEVVTASWGGKEGGGHLLTGGAP